MIVITEKAEWTEALKGIASFDFYHTFDYHQIVSDPTTETPCLFYFKSESIQIGLPLLVRRPIFDDDSLSDATSVYGYAGPIHSTKVVTAVDGREFQDELKSEFDKMSIVSVYSSFNPTLENADSALVPGDIVNAGMTASIDLGMPREEQWRSYRSNIRREIGALRNFGLHCEVSTDKNDLSAFINLYRDTMRRRGAGDRYLFPDKYFFELCNAEDFAMHLFACKFKDVVVGGGLFSECQGIVQYHLSGTHDDYHQMAPTKLMLDTVREWANDNGMRVFHLGGGVGAAEDSLFKFKKGFSNTLNDFKVWRWISNESAYDDLCERYKDQLLMRGETCIDQSFFPYYRAPSSSLP